MNRFTTDLVPNLQVTVRTVDLPFASPSLLRTPDDVRDVATDPVELLLMLFASVTVVAPFLPVTAHVAFFAVGTANRNFAATELGADVPAVVAGVAVEHSRQCGRLARIHRWFCERLSREQPEHGVHRQLLLAHHCVCVLLWLYFLGSY